MLVTSLNDTSLTFLLLVEDGVQGVQQHGGGHHAGRHSCQQSHLLHSLIFSIKSTLSPSVRWPDADSQVLEPVLPCLSQQLLHHHAGVGGSYHGEHPHGVGYRSHCGIG